MASAKTTLTIKNESGVTELEEVLKGIGGTAPRQDFILKASGATQPPLLRDMWLAMVIRAAFDVAPNVSVLSPGSSAWPDLDSTDFDDDGNAALSLPYLLALQRGARVLPEWAHDSPLPATAVRRHAVQRRGGVLGTGGKFRRLVEFDPDDPIAPAIGQHDDRSARLEQLILEMMGMFEIGAQRRKIAPVAMGPRRHIIDFLRELYANAYGYARDVAGVRTLGFQKHFYSREVAEQRAKQFPALLNFVRAQAGRTPNLIEATVSDFGPGIVGGFRSSEAAPAYAGWEDDRLLHALLHEQFSSNLDDPNAGLGILIALGAATKVGGFVTLRTGAHWLVLDPTNGGGTEMQPIPGVHPFVHGTHWAILYPDSPLA